MDRRQFAKTAVAIAALAGCTDSRLTVRSEAAQAMLESEPPPPVPTGTNLSGMEWAKPGLRHGLSSLPNLHFTVPRKADVAYLAATGHTRNRLPIQWELLQPMLPDTVADATAQAAIGAPGAFHAAYAAFIEGVLDAHAKAGTTCIVDLHNYCRYQDFRFQADGSVAGLVRPAGPLLRPYSSDPAQVQERIFALAPGATLTRAHFTEVWSRIARAWKDHPGFGGYGLMNEPHDLPRPGETVASTSGEDLRIWPAFALAAIDAIRAIDTSKPIYVAGNAWSSAMALASKNPGFPLAGSNLVYEVHMYLDARSSGHAFDYDTEVGKKFSAGIGAVAIDADTGVLRLRPAVEWARAHGVKLALTEIGMPVDDPRWEAMFVRAVRYARESGCEIYSWMGGAHWPSRNYAINHVPGWHQNRTLEPAVSGLMQAPVAVSRAALFDDGPGWAPPHRPVRITVYARGTLARPVSLTVSSSNAGRLSKTRLTIPAGANGSDSYTFTPPFDRVTTLSYESDGQLGGQTPPSRKVYSLANPVGHAALDLGDAAMAIVARYGASVWDLADGYTDFLQGAPARAGQPVRAIADSGFGSSPGNAMEMLNWANTDSAGMGSVQLPLMRVTGGRKHSDHSREGTWGFWCKKSAAQPGVQSAPKNAVAFNIEDAHFAIACLSVPRSPSDGVAFQCSRAEARYASEIAFAAGRPQARWQDAQGAQVVLTGPAALEAGVPTVVALTSAPGAQSLRVNSAVVGRGTASFAPSAFTQMLMGWGFLDHYPCPCFGGNIYAVIAGKGSPNQGELAVLERYLETFAGFSAG